MALLGLRRSSADLKTSALLAMADAFWLALGLLLVMEGVLPAIHPRAWRRTFEQLLGLSDQHIRTFGLLSMVAGLVLIWVL